MAHCWVLARRRPAPHSPLPVLRKTAPARAQARAESAAAAARRLARRAAEKSRRVRRAVGTLLTSSCGDPSRALSGALLHTLTPLPRNLRSSPLASPRLTRPRHPPSPVRVRKKHIPLPGESPAVRCGHAEARGRRRRRPPRRRGRRRQRPRRGPHATCPPRGISFFLFRAPLLTSLKYTHGRLCECQNELENSKRFFSNASVRFACQRGTAGDGTAAVPRTGGAALPARGAARWATPRRHERPHVTVRAREPGASAAHPGARARGSPSGGTGRGGRQGRLGVGERQRTGV